MNKKRLLRLKSNKSTRQITIQCEGSTSIEDIESISNSFLETVENFQRVFPLATRENLFEWLDITLDILIEGCETATVEKWNEGPQVKRPEDPSRQA